MIRICFDYKFVNCAHKLMQLAGFVLRRLNYYFTFDVLYFVEENVISFFFLFKNRVPLTLS